MGLRKHLKIIAEGLWFIVLLSFFASLCSLFISIFLIEPEYESSTTLYFIGANQDKNPASAYESILAGQQLIKDYRELVKSRDLSLAVLKQLRINDLSYKSLAENVTLSIKSDTRLLEIKVKDKDPLRAVQLVKSISKVFIVKILAINPDIKIITVDPPLPENEAVAPNIPVNTVLGLLIGAIVSIGTIYLMEYLKDTVKTPEDIENIFGCDITGIIPDSGKVSDRVMTEVFRLLCINIKLSRPGKKVRTIAVINAAPVGKASHKHLNLNALYMKDNADAAFCLAKAFGESGLKTLYIDADLRKPVLTKSLADIGEKGLSAILAGNELVDNIIKPGGSNNNFIKPGGSKGIYKIASGVIPENPDEMLESERFRNFLSKIGAQYDITILNTPSYSNSIDSSIIAGKTDGVILIIRSNVLSKTYIRMMGNRLEKAGARIIGVVLAINDRKLFEHYYGGNI